MGDEPLLRIGNQLKLSHLSISYHLRIAKGSHVFCSAIVCTLWDQLESILNLEKTTLYTLYV